MSVGTLRECGLSARGCGPPPNLSSWPVFTLSLEIVLNRKKTGRKLEEVDMDSFKATERFLDCLESIENNIQAILKGTHEYNSNILKMMYVDISYFDVESKIIDYVKQECEKLDSNSEKFYCKLIADLISATKILLGKENGLLGNHGKTFEKVLKYFQEHPYNRDLKWFQHPNYNI